MKLLTRFENDTLVHLTIASIRSLQCVIFFLLNNNYTFHKQKMNAIIKFESKKQLEKQDNTKLLLVTLYCNKEIKASKNN